ncbi:concanavalin A-like lectin/glucanase domain-containing protein [Globomyces pollinis-pini]|nr:concanavalin A-like lectin/glucanase domain-containing protein [Globomyces pollinis-pini]
MNIIFLIPIAIVFYFEGTKLFQKVKQEIILNSPTGFLPNGRYQLTSFYSPKDFFEGKKWFFYFTKDPNNGIQKYQTQKSATENNLIQYNKDEDTIVLNATRGPDGTPMSLRIFSEKYYKSGLFIYDIQHLPHGCGIWPAIWTSGEDWPKNGEIDMLEVINAETVNTMLVHSRPGCFFNISGRLCEANPIVNRGGCGTPTPPGYAGRPWNNNNGGILAMEWVPLSAGWIKIWQFPRGSIPEDILNGKPEPNNWPTPLNTFPFGELCGVESFGPQQLVINTAFCGDYAADPAIWGRTCGLNSPVQSRGATCADYVLSPQMDYSEAHLTLKSVKVYTLL